MDITYNYVPLFIDNDWSLVSIVPPNLNSQIQPQNINLIASIYDEFKTDKAINNVTSNINTSNINSSDIDIININQINNHITIAEIYDEENKKKSIFDLGNLKSKNRYIDKKNVLLGFGN